MPPTTGTARATLLRFVEEWVPYTLDLDANLDDDKLACLVAAICAERKLRLPGIAAAVAQLCGVAE